MTNLPHITREIIAVLADPSTSFWLKASLVAALSRDPVDASIDAEILARLLSERCQEILDEDQVRP